MIIGNLPKTPEIDYDKTKVMIQLSYPVGYSGASYIQIYSSGVLANSYSSFQGGTVYTVTVPKGNITVSFVSVPSGLDIPQSQTKTSVGGDTLSFSFALIHTPLTYVQSFTASTTWTVPAGVSRIEVFLLGGGAGGIGGQYVGAYTSYGGNGGGSGYVTRTTINGVIPNETLDIIVPGGGASGMYYYGYNPGGNAQIKRGNTVLAEAYGNASQSGGSGGGAGGYVVGIVDKGGSSITTEYNPGAGGVNGGTGGGNPMQSGGNGMGISTYDFNGVLRATGGAGGSANYSSGNGADGPPNSGNGGGGGSIGVYPNTYKGYAGGGGSGFVQVRYTI